MDNCIPKKHYKKDFDDELTIDTKLLSLLNKTKPNKAILEAIEEDLVEISKEHEEEFEFHCQNDSFNIDLYPEMIYQIMK